MSRQGRAFVTGADGFIGSHLTEMLLQKGYDVTAFCLYNSFGSHGWLQGYVDNPHPQLKLVLGDIRDSAQMRSVIKGHDIVFHLAALIAIPYSYVAPESYFQTNVMGTLNVAQAALDHQCSRLIHTSTSEVYGTARTVPIDEHHPLQGQSPYSASKIGADKLVESFQKSFHLPGATLRPFNTFGPRQSMRAVLPTVIAQVLSGCQKIKLGALSPTRDFNYVSDTARAFIALAEAPLETIQGEVFNTGTGKEISIGDVAALIAKLFRSDNVPIECESERLRPADSEVERLLSNPQKLMNATGWRPEVGLEEGIVHLAEWMKAQPNYISDKASIYRT